MVSREIASPGGNGGRYPYVRSYRVHGLSFDFWVPDNTAETWYSPETRELIAEPRELLRLVSADDTVLEVGSHYGFYSMLLTQAVTQGRFHGIEALPSNAMIAQSQVELNRVGHRCCIQNRAAADRPGTIAVHDRTNASISTTEDSSTLRVNSATCDQLDESHGPFTMLKIDVEGFEGFVLGGCANVLKRKPKLAIELHPGMAHYGTALNMIWDLIDAEAYEGTVVFRSNKEAVQRFEMAKIRLDEIANIFLRPRTGG